jgi:hypothetical protein
MTEPRYLAALIRGRHWNILWFAILRNFRPSDDR